MTSVSAGQRVFEARGFAHVAPARLEAELGPECFRSALTLDGLEIDVDPSSSDESRVRLRLRTSRFGRGKDLADTEARAVTTQGARARAELDHDLLVEWFELREQGIEQGWTLRERPSGEGPLCIGLAIEGGLGFRVDDGARSGRFVDGKGRIRLRYVGLDAFDARGRELDARLRATPSGLGIEVDDEGALYPITVDPLLTGPAWTAQGNQSGAAFGTSVACAGDVNGDGFSDVIVGAPLASGGPPFGGRAQVFLGAPAGPALDPSWTVFGDGGSSRFGASVATAGDVNGDGFSDVVVGAPRFTGNEHLEGKAFVYLGSSAGLALVPAWTVEGNQIDSGFGASVATAGDVNGDGFSDVVVGAWNWEFDLFTAGRVFVYHGSPLGLSPIADTIIDPFAYPTFGWSVSSAGDANGDGFDDVLIGQPGFDTHGAAWICYGSPSGVVASPVLVSSSFGTSIGISLGCAGDVNGDGYADSVIGASSPGSVMLLLGSGSGLGSFSTSLGEYRGSLPPFVATAGDVNGDGLSDVIVGNAEPHMESPPGGQVDVLLGRVGGFLGGGATIEHLTSGDRFGFAATSAGDVNGDGYGDVLVGVPGYDGFGQPGEGLAAIYFGASDGAASAPSWSMQAGQAAADLGASVASAGDVNGDGFSDVIAGAPGYDGFQRMDDGLAAVFLGGPGVLEGYPLDLAWTGEGAQDGAAFGTSVASAGDVDGDGYGDVIAGAPGFSNGQSGEGKVFVYRGSPSGLRLTPDWTAEGNAPNAAFGSSVAGGDANGDGYGDVAVGAPAEQSSTGRVAVFLGSGVGPSVTPAWTVTGSDSGDALGTSVAFAGDVNGDGFGDLLVGSPGRNQGAGTASLYLGSSTGPRTVASWTASSSSPGAAFGREVGPAGDVNGDGFEDALVWTRRFGVVETAGALFLGSASGLAPEPSQLIPRWPGAESWSIAAAGDVNADGYGDVLVAVEFPGASFALCYLGSAIGLVLDVPPLLRHLFEDGATGGAVAAAGDVNGDGFGDVLFGVSETVQGGGVLLFGGNGANGGWIRGPEQRQASDSAPIAELGRSRSTGFRLRVGLERSLAGFAWTTGSTPRVRLEWEVSAVPVVDARAGAGEAVPLTLPLVLDDSVAGLLPSTPHAWRARLRTDNPFLPVTPWFSLAGKGWTRTQLRTSGRPSGLLRAR